jgi:phosphoribosyl 1,2-cyclic phosphodiesterase
VPSPGPTTTKVGGNTSCVEVRCGDDVLVLDGGTGLRALGDDLLREEPVHASILFSHLHWDHIQGIPFFAPLFRSTTALTLYGEAGGSLEQILRGQMSGPCFPVRLDATAARLAFSTIPVGPPGRRFRVGRHFQILAARLTHPGGVLGFRITALGRSIVYATDTEHPADGELDPALLALAAHADVLVYDAQYTPDEYTGRDGVCRRGWGHSTWREGVRVARAAGVGQLVLTHHDPTHDDATVDAIERAAQELWPATVAAREGLEIALDAGATRRAA